MSIRDQMRVDLRQAMKASQKATVATLRTLLAAIDNAEAVPITTTVQPMVGISKDVPRKFLSEDDIHEIVRKEAESRVRTLREFEQLGLSAKVEELRAEVELIARYVTTSE